MHTVILYSGGQFVSYIRIFCSLVASRFQPYQEYGLACLHTTRAKFVDKVDLFEKTLERIYATHLYFIR